MTVRATALGPQGEPHPLILRFAMPDPTVETGLPAALASAEGRRTLADRCRKWADRLAADAEA